MKEKRKKHKVDRRVGTKKCLWHIYLTTLEKFEFEITSYCFGANPLP